MTFKHSRLPLIRAFKDIADTKQLTPRNFKVLYALFGGDIVDVLQIVENRLVTKIQSKSGRSMYQVPDFYLNAPKESNTVFNCLIRPRHCSCNDFLEKVILDESLIMCRHILAIRLSKIMNRMELELIDDVLFAERYYNRQ